MSDTSDSGRTSSASRASGPVRGDERSKMRDLARDGWSVRAIATELGRSPDTVSKNVRDVANERREQTAKATEAKSLDLAEQRAGLLQSSLQSVRAGLARWARVDVGDHRGSADEAKAVQSLASTYARLDERHSRAQAGQGMAEVDVWLAAMTAPAERDDEA